MIIDASIAIKWLKKEEESSQEALQILESFISGKDKIIVPSLFFIEVANSLVTKSNTTIDIIKKELDYLFRINLSSYDPDSKDIHKTSFLAKKYKTSVYDMLYAVVAKKHKTILITADDKFIQKTKFSFVKHISQV